MKPRQQEFITFYSPGTLFAESTTQPIASRDTRIAVAMAETIVERYNATPYGFTFSTRIVADPIDDGRGGTLEVESKTIATSGIHYIGGRLETLDDVEARNDPKESIMRSNMRWAPIVCVIEKRFRWTQPFGGRDCIVDATGTVIERGDDPKHVAYRAEVAARVG